MLNGGEEGSLNRHVAAGMLPGSVSHLVRSLVFPDFGGRRAGVVPMGQRAVGQPFQLLISGVLVLLGGLFAVPVREVNGEVGPVGVAPLGAVVVYGGYVLGGSDA